MTTPTKILILGGTGHIARHAATLLSASGYSVTSVFRNAARTDEVAATGATPVVGDLTDLTPALQELIQAADVVVFSAGAGGKGGPETTYAIDRDAAIAVMDLLDPARQRFLMVSYVGSATRELAEDQPLYHYGVAKQAADRHLAATELDYAILGPTVLNHEPASGLHVLTTPQDTLDGTNLPSTSRELVAEVIAHLIGQDSFGRRTIEFHDGDTAVTEL